MFIFFGCVSPRSRDGPTPIIFGLERRVTTTKGPPCVHPPVHTSSAQNPSKALLLQAWSAFGEISEEARTLLCYAADATAARTWVADGATSEEHAAALLKNRLYRRWGIKTAREYARIKIDGLRLVGGNPDFTSESPRARAR